MNDLDEKTKTFIARAKAVHGDKYDYSQTVYTGSDKRISVGCSRHGLWTPVALDHLRYGCRQCGIESSNETRTYSQEQFIAKAKAVHGNKYDYSRVVYKGHSIKVEIGCPLHGFFWQSPVTHTRPYPRAHGCGRCGGNTTYTTEEYINACSKIHNGKFDYSKTIYSGSDKDLIIICPFHGEWVTKGSVHLAGSDCPKCARITTGEKIRGNTAEFIERAKLVHCNKNYDYSETVYTGSNDKIIVKCPIHNLFTIRPASFLRGDGCYKCGRDSHKAKLTKTQDELFNSFITRAGKVHGNKYTYRSDYYVDSQTKTLIGCSNPKHKDFWQLPTSHTAAVGCPSCNESKGERAVAAILDSININYVREHKLPDNQYEYDFYLPDHNLFIEFHGIQHYEHREFFHKTRDEFLEKKHIDKIKAKLVKAYGCRLIVLHYKQLEEGVLADSLLAQLKKLKIIPPDVIQEA